MTTGTILVSPAEPASMRPPITSFVHSAYPEALGCDYLYSTSSGSLAGVQRKSFPEDLVASLRDGRLQREIPQMRSLPNALLLLEGRPKWTSSGALQHAHVQFSRAQFHGLILSIQFTHGIHWAWSDNHDDSLAIIQAFFAWIEKNESEGHKSSLLRRPGPGSGANERDWAVHFLQGLPGIGLRQAERILDYFGGLPIEFSSTREELLEIDGIGKKTVDRIFSMLSRSKKGRG